MLENKVENKAKFFAQYWGQKVMRRANEFLLHNTYEVNGGNLDRNASILVLLLKPLSAISDEHAIEVANIFDLDEDKRKATDLAEWIEALFTETAGYYIDGYTGNQLLEAIDYLRSKGYALPYLGLSVEQQIEYGWIRLTQ